MRILLGSSEVHPYSKTGGLADMVGALAKALDQAGHQVGVVTPLYRGIRERFPEMKQLDWHMELPMGSRRVAAEVWTLPLGIANGESPASNSTRKRRGTAGKSSKPESTIYFIRHPGYYDRAGIYMQDGMDYTDNAERFIFLSKAIVHLARYLPWQPEVVHVHDWQTGLVPILMRHANLQEGWGNRAGTCFTIHNLAYQGVFPAAQFGLTNLPPDYFNPQGLEFHSLLNCLKGGITYSDIITTVSPRYAREITTPEFGWGLDGLLRKRQAALTGILNGVDYGEWRTLRNPHLKHPYSARDLTGKLKDKKALQKEMGLPVDAAVPLFGNISRLAEQKGVDIQLGALEEMLGRGMQFILLGSGDPAYEKAYRELARRHPKKVAVRIGFDQGLSHRIEAGSDFYLMPSRFEPCGLNQMYSLRYGTIPIVRATGGLDDTVVDIAERMKDADGIKFTEYSGRALAKAIRKALALYGEPALFGRYRQNAMRADFSWERVMGQFLAVYGRALRG